MKKFKKIQIETTDLEQFICDKCNKVIDPYDHEMDEVFSYEFIGGYSSIFGDGSLVQVDLCQKCLRDVIGGFCRINEF